MHYVLTVAGVLVAAGFSGWIAIGKMASAVVVQAPAVGAATGGVKAPDFRTLSDRDWQALKEQSNRKTDARIKIREQAIEDARKDTRG